MSTIREIARELNLSHTTVSRVLNTRNEQTISKATRDRVWETARRMGYRPHAVARALATGKTYQVGLMMRHLYSSFHACVVHEVEQTLRRSGYQVVIATVSAPVRTHPSATGEETLSPTPWQVDGCLAFESASLISAELSPKRPGGKAIPLVAMGGHNLGEVPDVVGFDLESGTDAALAHLLALAPRRIAFVTEERDDPRRRRYRETATGTDRMGEEIIMPSQNRGEVREAVRRHFARAGSAERRPDALFCFNDEVAIGAYRALRDLGLRIPEDVAIVGFDGIEDAAYLDTPLTTVVLPIAEMCRLSWEVLQRRMADPEASPSRTMLRPTLVVRESTRGPAVAARPLEYP